jgi:murein DD-endopeptidase MepM/ murein hydrolase activator NlpD
MPPHALATAAFLVLAPTVALAAVPAVHANSEAAAAPRPRTPATSGTAPPAPSSGARRPATVGARRGEPGAVDRWTWPLSPRPAVLRGFSVGPYRWSPGHRGVDLAARPGAQVVAPAAGVVTFARTVVSRPVLVITHDDGVRTAYEPVTSVVASGSRVGRGAVIGTVTNAVGHCRPQSCVHWSARRGDRYFDPLSLLSPPRVALLPLPRDSPPATG